MYNKLSGMTGTAITEEEEFRGIYSLDVVEIPTNRPMIRKDHNDVMYTTLNGKYRAIIQQVLECNKKGQPVLVGTASIEKSEFLSKILAKNGIKHNVLNAKNHEKEAEIIAQAGKFGAVTIATNMAGRGTDIMLGGNSEYLAKSQMRTEGFTEEQIFESTEFGATEDESILAARARFKEIEAEKRIVTDEEKLRVLEAGGLFILGTERHESRRIDNQLRGRSGRQGDPGESRFFLSMQDDLMRLFGGDRIQAIAANIPDDQPIDLKILSNSVETAQKRVPEGFSRNHNILAVIFALMALVYGLVVYIFRKANALAKSELTEVAYRQQLDAAKTQISVMNEAQRQAAIYRHDMRHNLTTIDAFLSTEHVQQARDYIKKVQGGIDALALQHFCENDLVNLLCSSFSDKAKRTGIRLTADTHLPEELSVSDTELCAILSNGFENAFHAVSELDSSRRWIKLYSSIRQENLLIEITNPYQGEVTIRDGLPVSSRDGHGYGCLSIQSIAAHRKGICTFDAKQGVFTLRVVLPVHHP